MRVCVTKYPNLILRRKLKATPVFLSYAIRPTLFRKLVAKCMKRWGQRNAWNFDYFTLSINVLWT